MIASLLNAVGPVQPNEQRAGEVYRCEVGRKGVDAPDRQECLFHLHDGGVGATVFGCMTHNYSFVARDK